MEVLLTGLLTFFSTNIDDLFILVLFYSHKRFRESQIVGGQLLGIGSLIAVSLAASLSGLFVPLVYIGLLGLLPVYLGMKALWQLFRKNTPAEHKTEQVVEGHRPLFTIAGVTFANGGDNIAINTPCLPHWPGRTSCL
jgi:cadmium resistance protein CadD (predicted permease)